MLHFFLVPLFHVALYLRVALFPCYTFSCCIFFILHSSPVALFSCCIFFLLQFIRVAPCFPVALLHCFPVALFSCCFLFHTALFTCCNFFLLHFFQFGLSVLICFMLYSFHVKFFRCYTFVILWLFPCCTLFIMHTPIAIKLPCTQSSMKLRSYDVAVFSGCTFSCSNFFMLHSSVLHLCHVAPYLVVISFCYIFQKHLQIHFCLGYKLNKAVIGAKI